MCTGDGEWAFCLSIEREGSKLLLNADPFWQAYLQDMLDNTSLAEDDENEDDDDIDLSAEEFDKVDDQALYVFTTDLRIRFYMLVLNFLVYSWCLIMESWGTFHPTTLEKAPPLTKKRREDDVLCLRSPVAQGHNNANTLAASTPLSA